MVSIGCVLGGYLPAFPVVIFFRWQLDILGDVLYTLSMLMVPFQGLLLLTFSFGDVFGLPERKLPPQRC